MGITAENIVLTGGGANSDSWRQMVADICNAPVTVVKNAEAAAFGVALQAVSILDGNDKDLSDLVIEHLQHDTKKGCEPQPSAVNLYNDTYHDYQRAVENVTALYG